MPRRKSNNGRAGTAGAHLEPLVDPRLIKSLSHVLRQHILLGAVQGEVSPNELSKALGEELSQVSYHVKVLRDECDGMILETRTEPRRGAVEHYYPPPPRRCSRQRHGANSRGDCARWSAPVRQATCSTI